MSCRTTNGLFITAFEMKDIRSTFFRGKRFCWFSNVQDDNFSALAHI